MACADGSTSHRPGFKQTSYSNLKYKFMNKTFIRQAKRSFTFLFMLGLCAIWSPRAAAQNRSLPQVTIRMDRVPMSQIMSEIERQTKYLFVTGSDVKTDRITSLDVTAVPLTEALNRMVAGADLTYDIPPCFICSGECDPLLDGSRVLYEMLNDKGFTCELKLYPGIMHAFLHYSRMLDESYDAMQAGADFMARARYIKEGK